MNRDTQNLPHIFVHGMFGAGSQWANFASYFGDRGCEVHTPTLLGHHGSMEGGYTSPANLSVED